MKTKINADIVDLITDVGVLGIYVYICSKPKNWIFSYKDLANRFMLNKKTIQKKFKYLCDIGVAKNVPIRKDGKIVCWEKYILHYQNEGHVD